MRPSRSILSPQELEERRALILALLEEAPYSIGQLSALMRLHRGAVNAALRMLARQQQVHRGADDRWRLGTRETRHESRSPDGDGHLGRSSGSVGAEQNKSVPRDPRPDADGWHKAGSEPADAHLFDEDDVSDIDEDIVDDTPALRQPRAATKMTVEAAPSWWTTAPREGFSQLATVEYKRMRGSKEAHQVPLRLLGERT